MDKAMTEAANIERQKRRQAEFVNDEQQRLLEIEDMRLVVKFGEKKRYSDQECQAIYQELVDAGLDDEARRDPGGARPPRAAEKSTGKFAGTAPTPSKRFSRNSMPTTRLRRQDASSAAEPQTLR
jgi:hypothetical protein